MTQTIEQLRARIAELESNLANEQQDYRDCEKMLHTERDVWQNERDGFVSKIAELEAQSDPEALHIAYLQGQATANETTRKQADRIKELEAAHAATVLNNQQLRDAHQQISVVASDMTRHGNIVFRDMTKIAEGAVATPISTEALDAYVSEKVKEAMK